MQLNFTAELALLMRFAGETAAAIRMYSAYSNGTPSRYLNVPHDPERESLDLMFLSDSLHHFDKLGQALHDEIDPAKLVQVCDELLQNFSHYDVERPQFGMRQAKPTFERWENLVDLKKAREAMIGIRSKAKAALAQA